MYKQVTRAADHLDQASDIINDAANRWQTQQKRRTKTTEMIATCSRPSACWAGRVQSWTQHIVAKAKPSSPTGSTRSTRPKKSSHAQCRSTLHVCFPSSFSHRRTAKILHYNLRIYCFTAQDFTVDFYRFTARNSHAEIQNLRASPGEL
jgi:hypothetical protein